MQRYGRNSSAVVKNESHSGGNAKTAKSFIDSWSDSLSLRAVGQAAGDDTARGES